MRTNRGANLQLFFYLSIILYLFFNNVVKTDKNVCF